MDPLRASSYLPIASPWLAAPSAPPPAAAPVEHPRDLVLAGPPHDDPSPAEKPTWRSRAWRLAKIGIFGTVATASVLGGIAYTSNHEALSQPITVTRTLPPPAPAAAPAAVADPAPPRAAMRPASMVVVLPERTLQDVSRTVQTSPQFQATLRQHAAEVQAQIQQKLADLPVVDRTELIDLHAPLPTGDRSFLHVGPLDLPAGGLGQLQQESIPLVVTAHVQPQGLPVRVEIAQVLPSADGAAPPKGPPGAVYVGSYRTSVYAAAPSVHVTGAVRLESDLDGHATRASMAERGDAGRLEGRLAQGQRLRELGAKHGFGWILNATLADQGVTFARDVALPQDVPLVEGIHHLWLLPDGQAHMAVTDELRTPGIDRLSMQGQEMQAVPHAAVTGVKGWPAERLHDLVSERIAHAVEEQLREFSTQLPAQARGTVQTAWGDAARSLQGAADGALRQAYQEHSTEAVHLGHARLPGAVMLNLGDVVPVAGGMGVTVHLDAGGHGTREAGDVTRFLTQPALLPEAVRAASGPSVAVSGDTLNAALRDVHEGGTGDWGALLADMAHASGLKSLEFDKDPNGRLLSPQLEWRNGGPAITMEITAEAAGLAPVGAVTGVASGATHLLDSGASGVQSGLSDVAGVPGKVVGTVVRAPFFIVDKLVGGVKDVVDGTVGAVIDHVPEAGTRPVVSMRLSVPIRLEVRDGVLVVTPDAAGVQASAPVGSKSRIMLPTNVLQSLVAQAMTGSGSVGSSLHGFEVPIDVRARGVRFTAAAATGPQQVGGAPDVVVGVSVDVPLLTGN